ncbi:Glu-tRNA(Gln) amidotransferase subunit GatE [Methanoregula formicica]|uniref:Glutamyl-tRNA(Gln) amidotransferase subunit E n=1 Tax=Methanoregula formicica (strain DSM 22288 / NBRC 105244 / SMSP) TaxID=593750 RepID=L0HF95_METFS|nr:Glu-tRNA(Gln) amidotransferase subunit GatE [Methanoregula formicica]AGB03412.1 glutamyl-tRNA(Gln) amidotransferase, subunit E [Methanoregula formicica SMSP]
MDYKKAGLVAGIEIHQQLDTAEKLFCHCPTTLREIAEHNGEFSRYLRATVSEMGEIDRAAKEEMKSDRKFLYYAYDTTCLVENDEEPPAPMNDEALSVCLTIGKMFGMTPVPQVHTMRKLVIDGSNTSGFQRTALVALNGKLPNSGEIETICLEEEACQRVKDEVFSLDRLGIPLIEITTSPCMHTPEDVQKVAEYIGMVLRSTGKVKRGIGTIRQDVNISIAAGARVEIKGVQELDLIAEVVRREVQRQTNLLAIRDELKGRGATIGATTGTDVTELFKETKSAVLKKAKKIHAIVLPGFAGLVGREIQPERRLGSEMSDYAKKCGVGGIFHTDELPAYGVTAEEVAMIRTHLKAGERDCVIIASGTSEKQASCAIAQVVTRAQIALSDKPVPEETRKMLESGSTAYMRPLPGAARMYPETDVLPVTISEARWNAVKIPELLTARAERYAKEYEIELPYALQLAGSEKLPLFERAVKEGIRAKLAAFTILSTATELRRDGIDIAKIPDQAYLDTWHAVEGGKAAREAIPEIFRSIAAGSSFEESLKKLAPAVSREELEAIVRKIIAERSDFVAQKGKGALGPLMGVVMAEVRGSVDGKLVSEVLRKEIERASGTK